MADTFNIEFKASKNDANWILSGCRGEPTRMVLARTPALDAHLGTGGQVRVVYTTVDKSVELQTRAGVPPRGPPRPAGHVPLDEQGRYLHRSRVRRQGDLGICRGMRLRWMGWYLASATGRSWRGAEAARGGCGRSGVQLLMYGRNRSVWWR